MRKGEVLVGASILAGLNIGSSIGKAISRNSLRNALRERFQDHFIDAILELTDAGTAPESAIDIALSKYVYQSLFKKFGEDAADFYLSKYNKAKTMGVDFDYDVEIAKYLDGAGLKHVAAPYSDILLGILLANPDAPLQKTYSADTKPEPVDEDAFMKGKVAEVAKVISEGVKFGRPTYEGLLSKKGFVFNNVKYDTEAEANAQRDTYIKAMKTAKLMEAAERLLRAAESEIKRIDKLTVTHGKLPYEGWGASPKYRITELPDLEFSKKDKLDAYLEGLRKPHKDVVSGCKVILSAC